jgi:transposase
MCLYAKSLSEAEGRLVQCEIRHGRDAIYVKRCQVILASAQGMRVKEIAKLTLLSEYHIRMLIRAFNRGGLPAVKPRKPKGRDPSFTDEERATIAEFARIPPKVLGYPFTSWSLSKLKMAVEERRLLGRKPISDESIRQILEEYGVSYQRTKTWKESRDPKFDSKKSGS